MANVNLKSADDFFSFLLGVPTVAWRFHLSTSSHSEHVTLNDFYDDVQDDIDSLIECYMGVAGKMKFLQPVEFDTIPGDAVSYLEDVLTVIADANDTFTCFTEHSELQSELDNVVSTIDSTIYKLKNLK